MPYADKFQLHIYAALAEQERDFIESSRTKASLAAAKGNVVSDWVHPVHRIAELAATQKKKALKDAQKVSGVILPLRESGDITDENLREVLNSSGSRTSRGGKFPSITGLQDVKTLEGAS